MPGAVEDGSIGARFVLCIEECALVDAMTRASLSVLQKRPCAPRVLATIPPNSGT